MQIEKLQVEHELEFRAPTNGRAFPSDSDREQNSQSFHPEAQRTCVITANEVPDLQATTMAPSQLAWRKSKKGKSESSSKTTHHNASLT